MSFENVPDFLRDRSWYCGENAYAFLVDAPITLGHSQLKVLVNHAQQEEDSFSNAAKHIAGCIKTLRTVLCDLQLDNWATLANYTGTSGKYQKTLVLKVSANEANDEYKLHLVPYFSSHFIATNKLYAAIQNLDQDAIGGMLHWVGQRERIVDYDMRYGREDETVKKRIASFNLPQLASKLRLSAR